MTNLITRGMILGRPMVNRGALHTGDTNRASSSSLAGLSVSKHQAPRPAFQRGQPRAKPDDQ